MENSVKDLFQREVENFVERYQNPTLIDRHLRKSIFLRFEEALSECRKYGHKEILDVGSGAGLQAMMLANEGINVTGIDISDNMVRRAQAIAQTGFLKKDSGKVDFRVCDLLDAGLEKTYDMVMALGVFDYTAQPLVYLSKMKELARKEVLASFPASADILFPQRWLRYKFLKRCDIYCYSRKKIEGLANACAFSKWDIKKLGRDHLLCGYL